MQAFKFFKDGKPAAADVTGYKKKLIDDAIASLAA